MATLQAQKTITVALVGNPNTGKSTLFNALSGLNQRVGNYPGVTIEKKIGHYQFADQGFQVIRVDQESRAAQPTSSTVPGSIQVRSLLA